VEVAAALARMSQGEEPFLLPPPPHKRPADGPRFEPPAFDRPPRRGARGNEPRPTEHFRLEVGHVHGVTPGSIVGAIANETGLEGRYIGQIDIHEDFTIVDLPPMPDDVFHTLQRVRVAGQKLQISRIEPHERPASPKRRNVVAGPPSRPGFKPGPKRAPGPKKGNPENFKKRKKP
jgi:ATP-dependent RNA helicase DeaD